MLYDLTSTYVEGEAEQNPKARYRYSRDGKPNCKQVVIRAGDDSNGSSDGLRSDGGNTSDKTTMRGFLDKIEDMYGLAHPA